MSATAPFRLWLAGALLGAGVAVTAVPAPDLSGTEPQVAAKIEAARRYAESRPDADHAWGVLAMNLDAHGYAAEALAAYARAAELDPQSFAWPYLRGLLLAATGAEEAGDSFTAALRLRPDYGPLRVAYGGWLAERGERQRARQLLAGVADQDPAAGPAALALARMALADGDLDGALGEAGRALAAVPRDPAVHGLLAGLYRRAGDLDRAERHERFRRLLPEASEPADPVRAAVAAEGVSSAWHRRRGRALLAQGEPERALAELRQAHAAAPTAETEDALGLALQALGRPAEAVAHHRAALALRPGLAEAAHHLGAALLAAGETEEGLAALARALALRPGLAAAALDLGTHLQRLGRRREAIAAYRRGETAAPDDPRLLARLAWLLAVSPEAELRDGNEALRLAREACRLTGWELPEAVDVLAAALAESGDFEAAATRSGQARELARAQGRAELARAIAERQALYRRGRAYRTPATRARS